MGQFFPDGVVTKQSYGPPPGVTPNPMAQAVQMLSPSAKQAMFAVLQSGKVIARRTWNGCAFNAAGDVAGRYVSSTQAAASTFHMSASAVGNFIKAWDGLECDDRRANKYLLEALKEIGTHTPEQWRQKQQSRAGQVIRGYAYKSEATKFAEQLASGELTVDMIPGCDTAELLLAGASA